MAGDNLGWLRSQHNGASITGVSTLNAAQVAACEFIGVTTSSDTRHLSPRNNQQAFAMKRLHPGNNPSQ